MGRLSSLPLYDCGEFVSSRLRYFEKALTEYRNSKSSKKRESTLFHARRAGSDIIFAFGQMKDRLETEEKEGELFYVNDPSFPPSFLTNGMRARVSFRWRGAETDQWTHGAIEFAHEVTPRLDLYALTQPKPKRKPSKMQLEEQRQDELRVEWEHLELLAHTSVRDYFKAGHDGAAIPKVFTAKVGHDGRLNNFSADFWRDRG